MCCLVSRIIGLSHLLVHDDADCVVEDTLPKDDRVQFWVDLVGIEDGEDSDRVGGRQGGTEDEAFEKGELEPLEAQERPDVHQYPTKMSTRSRNPTHPMPTAEMNVPRNAKVRMTPKLRKKFSCPLARHQPSRAPVSIRSPS